ncbi:MAG: NAD(P)H-dependent oxidoreductase [Cytophagaceae bacterium]|nr:NAD(P)H-dependent oxidoreductase [Cytophagaceae bacterium]MDW8456881.1 NAD(P)H-dependent oxidoreductase [Cytophagaceae bacterium]
MISIVSSTNRKNSITLQLARMYHGILTGKNAEAQIIDLSELPHDFVFSALYENKLKNQTFNTFVDKINQSEKFVFIVPEYNGSFPGVLKAFIDGLEFPSGFKNKKCALVGLSSGTQGASLAMSHLTDILNYLGMHVLAVKPRLANIDSIWQDDVLSDNRLYEMLHRQAQALIDF